MAINVYGVPSSIDAAQWSRLLRYNADTINGQLVVSGLGVSVTSATARTVSVAAGTSVQAGTLADVTAAQTLTLDATPTSRVDTIALQVNWSGTTATAGSLVVVKGSSALPATLTQNPGVLWQVPLARVPVGSNSQITTADVTQAQPRGGSDLTSATMTFPGNFTASTPALTVRKIGRMVEFTGQFIRNTSTISRGGSSATVNLIPPGYRPISPVDVAVMSEWTAAAPKFHTLDVQPNGDVTLFTGTGDINSGDVLRMITATWFTPEG